MDDLNVVALAILILGMATFFGIGWYSRRWTNSTAEFYVAGGHIPWKLNGVAMFSNYASAASFLGVAGAIALFGIDNWWLALGFFAGWVVVVLIIASPLRRSGKYTVADALQERFSGPDIRVMTIITGVIIGTIYLVPQLVGAGHLFNLLIPLEAIGLDASYIFWVGIAGGFTAAIVVLGGMRGTSYNQAFQGIIIFGAMTLLLVLSVVLYFSWNPLNVLTEADHVVPPQVLVDEGAADQILAEYPVDSSGDESLEAAKSTTEILPDAPTAMTPGVNVRDLLNQLSLVLGLFLGVVGLPHVLIRLYTVKNAEAARKSTEFTIVALAIFYTMTLFVGLAAMMLLYPLLTDLINQGEIGKATNTAVAELGALLGGRGSIGGDLFLGIVLAGAMAAILSSAVGLLIQMTTTVAHDGYTVLLRPQSSEQQRVLVARIAGIVLTIVAVLMAIWLKEENVAQLVGMAFGIAASTFAPVLLLTVWWTRFTRQGVIAGFVVGLLVSLLFTFLKFLEVDEFLFLPVLVNPALYGVPAAFIAAIVTSYATHDVGDVDRFMHLAHDRAGVENSEGAAAD
ncbi:MAG: cation acetate symporter [Acidimicrobiia bacterium]|nr:cation acetate symporter [Acidimicrobiia bacterium]